MIDSKPFSFLTMRALAAQAVIANMSIDTNSDEGGRTTGIGNIEVITV
jgi:hypothetical protein